jgi:hypothetical protein
MVHKEWPESTVGLSWSDSLFCAVRYQLTLGSWTTLPDHCGRVALCIFWTLHRIVMQQ